jgi:hypothetical protein
MLPYDFTSCPLFEGCFSYLLSGLFGFCMLSSLALVVSCCLFHFLTCVLFPDSVRFFFVIPGLPSFVDLQPSGL